jgi:type IV pilus assembly protein PilC
MPLFSYTATNSEGKKIVGQQEAETRDQVVQMLHDQSLVVISIEEKVELDLKKLGSLQIGGVPLSEKVLFTKQLSTMLATGLPIIQALDIIVQQTENESLREKLRKVYKSVESGSSLSDAFRKERPYSASCR